MMKSKRFWNGEINEIVVKDESDGISVWTPHDETQIEIQQHDNPETRAIEICEKEPMRGNWAN